MVGTVSPQGPSESSLLESATKGTSILTSPPPTLHCVLNAGNTTALKSDCALTYACKNLYLSTSLFQSLLQKNFLAIPDPDVPTVLWPLLTPPYSAGPVNAQKQALMIQFLLLIGNYFLSKEEADKLMDQRVHVLTSTKELWNSMINFVNITGE